MSIDILQVKVCMDTHIKKAKKSSDIAAHLKISPETLRKTFKAEEHVSLRKNLFKRKVWFMQELLFLEPDMTCKQICCEIGLREDSGTRIFKKFSGMTIGEFLEKMKDTEKRNEFLTQHRKEIAEEKK